MEKVKKLTEIQSLHEQREIFGNPDVLIKNGVWIEVVGFNPTTERVDVKHRWQVEKVKTLKNKNTKIFTVTCRALDIKKYEDMKKKLAKKVFNKHETILKASFIKCLVEGIGTRTSAEMREMLIKLEGGKNGK